MNYIAEIETTKGLIISNSFETVSFMTIIQISFIKFYSPLFLKMSEILKTNFILHTNFVEITLKADELKTSKITMNADQLCVFYNNSEDIKIVFHYPKLKDKDQRLKIKDFMEHFDSQKVEVLQDQGKESTKTLLDDSTDESVNELNKKKRYKTPQINFSNYIEGAKLFCKKVCLLKSFDELLQKIITFNNEEQKVSDGRCKFNFPIDEEEKKEMFSILQVKKYCIKDLNKQLIIPSFQNRWRKTKTMSYLPWRFSFPEKPVIITQRTLKAEISLLKLMDNLTNFGQPLTTLDYDCWYYAFEDNLEIKLMIDKNGIPKIDIKFNPQYKNYNVIINNLKTIPNFHMDIQNQELCLESGAKCKYHKAWAFVQPITDRYKDLDQGIKNYKLQESQKMKVDVFYKNIFGMRKEEDYDESIQKIADANQEINKKEKEIQNLKKEYTQLQKRSLRSNNDSPKPQKKQKIEDISAKVVDEWLIFRESHPEFSCNEYASLRECIVETVFTCNPFNLFKG